MGKIILLEGPDQCGKTEMSKELSRLLGIPYFKNKSEWSAFDKDPNYFVNALRYGDPYFYSFLADTGTSVVLDRSYPSEWVYSRVFGRQTDDDALRRIDDIAAKAGACIIAPYRTSYKGIKDPMHSISEEHLEKISSTYKNFTEWTKCKTLRLCVDSEDLAWEMREILAFIAGGNK